MQVISISHADRISCQNAYSVGEGDASRDGVNRLVDWWPAFQKDPVGVGLDRGRRICGGGERHCRMHASGECTLQGRCRARCAVIYHYHVFGDVELFVNGLGQDHGGFGCPGEGRIYRNICRARRRRSISCQSGIKYTTTYLGLCGGAMKWLSPDQSVSAPDRAEAILTATESTSLQPLDLRFITFPHPRSRFLQFEVDFGIEPKRTWQRIKAMGLSAREDRRQDRDS